MEVWQPFQESNEETVIVLSLKNVKSYEQQEWEPFNSWFDQQPVLEGANPIEEEFKSWLYSGTPHKSIIHLTSKHAVDMQIGEV